MQTILKRDQKPRAIYISQKIFVSFLLDPTIILKKNFNFVILQNSKKKNVENYCSFLHIIHLFTFFDNFYVNVVY
jgi:hypothetical protein